MVGVAGMARSYGGIRRWAMAAASPGC